MAGGSDHPGDRFQVRLSDLVVVVVGAAYVLDVARRSRVAWGGGLPDLAHAVGLMVLGFGVAVGLVMVGQWVRRGRGESGRAWALTWRVLAVGWLAGALVEVAAALQVSKTPAATVLASYQVGMRLRLSTLMASIGMVGVMLASVPLRARSRGVGPRARWGSWPSVILATVFGLAVLTLGHGTMPYLILLALEAVRNALTRVPLVARPGLFDRLTTAGLEALPGLIGCLATAAWVDDDLREAARDPLGSRALRSWRGVIARSAWVVLAAAGSAYTWLVAIPALNPNLVEGLGLVLDPSLVAAVVLSFAALAAGFAARGAGHLARAILPQAGPAVSEGGGPSPVRKLGPWPRWTVNALVGLACLELTAAAFQAAARDDATRWFIPVDFHAWMAFFQGPATRLSDATGFAVWPSLMEFPDDLVACLVAAWLTVRLVKLLGWKQPDPSSPLDAIAADRLALGRFLGWWLALSTAILASLPGLALAAVTLTHYVIRWTSR